jgi:hypothetical protein
MTNNKFNIGEKLIFKIKEAYDTPDNLENYPEIETVLVQVVAFKRNIIGIEFLESKLVGHNLDGILPTNNGWWVYKHELERIHEPGKKREIHE